ncbi:hypothetical protein DLJ53_21110 [Acuticoccus sediminis]|uniref:Uncharacterized protein n=1 Tax=Acuticoccus sediminis TaxID=2184697 RepID=A0A8B2NQC7_9HYPH|nr:DUF6505 family protein [Acuticoccus sediminis]RAI00208.1 hypothetical protein DLJ53_21110 [Acuticoccus sediminis]
MTHLARVIRLDESDLNVFEHAAEPGEWVISGAFAYSNWTEADLTGKRRQAFAHGWLGLETFGRASVVAVAPITEREWQACAEALADHFVAHYGAPSRQAAMPVALEELGYARDLCNDYEPNTLILVERTLEPVGVRERFRPIAPTAAPLESFAVHGS